jgi:hypothetical protein
LEETRVPQPSKAVRHKESSHWAQPQDQSDPRPPPLSRSRGSIKRQDRSGLRRSSAKNDRKRLSDRKETRAEPIGRGVWTGRKNSIARTSQTDRTG